MEIFVYEISSSFSTNFPFTDFIASLKKEMAGYSLTRVPYPVYPLIGVIGGAVVFASWYLARLARGPDVVWAKSKNPTPWLNIKENETVKMMNPNGSFESKWKRSFF